MNFLFIGDIVGKPGRDVVTAHLPGLNDTLKLDWSSSMARMRPAVSA